MKIYEKIEPVKYVEINGKEFRVSSVISALNDMFRTTADDYYGEDSLRDHELSSDIEIYDTLAEMGLVKHWRIGSQESTLYCRAADETNKLGAMLDELCGEFDK